MSVSFKTLRNALMICVLSAGVSMTAMAEDVVTEVPEGAEVKTIENPKMDEVREMAEKLSKSLSEKEVSSLAMVRDGFGMIRSVELAQETVEDAIEACAKANPDMADDLNARHDAWEDAIDAAIDAQEDNLDAAISKKIFKDPDAIEDYLDAIEDAAEYTESNIEKQLITSESACKNLKDSMDGTQETITTLLGDIAWPKEQTADTSSESTAEEAE